MFHEPQIPTSIGRCADQYSEVRALRLAMEKEVEEVKSFESRLRQHMIDNLSSSDDTGAAGLKYRVQIVTKATPRVISDGEFSGWSQLWDYIAKTGRWDLLQKRISDKAVKDMWDEGEAVPGVEKINVKDVSITKI